MSRPRAVLLDFGNTLVFEGAPASATDAEGGRRLETHLARRILEGEASGVAERFLRLRRDGIDRSRRTFVEEPSRRLLAEAFAAAGFPPPAEREVDEALEAFFAGAEANFAPVPGATAVLDRLREEGFRLALVSNNTHAPLIDRALERFGLIGRLDLLFHSSTFGLRKPDPRIFLAAAEGLGVEPRDCAHVGDLPLVDVAGARAAGMKAVLARVVPGLAGEAPPEGPAPDAVVEDLGRLPDVAGALLRR